MEVAWFDYKDWAEISEDYRVFEEPLNEDNCQEIDADIISVFVSSNVSAEVLETVSPEVVVTRSTGYDHIDLEKAEELGVEVYNVPHYGSNTVAEHAFGLLLGLSKKIPEADERSHHEFSYNGLEGFELKGKKLGVIGTGEIGQKAIKMAKSFEMNVIAYDPYPDKNLEEALGFMYVSLEDLIDQSDIISLHCPLTDDNHHLLSREEFGRMDSTVLINTARGSLVDSEALVDALERGNVKQAGLDTLELEDEMRQRDDYTDKTDFCCERFKANCELINRDDVLVTPHSAFNTTEAKKRIVDTTLENIKNRPSSNKIT